MSQKTIASNRPTLLVRLGNFFFLARNQLTPLVLFTLFAVFKPRYPGGREAWDWGLDALGLVLALSGQILRAAVIGYVYIKRGGKDKKVYADELVTEGFFRHSRNPLYLGNLMVLLGLFLIHHNPWAYALGLPFFLLLYMAIVATEEAYLRGQFGEQYEDYCRQVNRWWPNFRGLRQTLASHTFRWRRLIVKEYGSTYAWIATALLLLAYETLTHFRYEQRPGYLNTLAVLLLLATVGWGVARYLKLSGRLRAD
jgi:protein-S-isoprenylcysteine O-methyltransferase Ste14